MPLKSTKGHRARWLNQSVQTQLSSIHYNSFSATRHRLVKAAGFLDSELKSSCSCSVGCVRTRLGQFLTPLLGISFGDFPSPPQTLRKIGDTEIKRNDEAQKHRHFLLSPSVNSLCGHSVSHCCLAVSLCRSFVLGWGKRRATASKCEWLESSDLNVHTHIIWAVHTEDTLCDSVNSAGAADSICSVPHRPPSAPHPLWQVEGIQTHQLWHTQIPKSLTHG